MANIRGYKFLLIRESDFLTMKKRSRDGKCGFEIAIEPQSPTRKLGFAMFTLRVLASNKLKKQNKNKRLTDSAVPTLSDLPDHLQKTSRPRATATSKRAAEPLSVQCVAVSADVGAAETEVSCHRGCASLI
ncbi:hypothetical protein CAPTEDRAFT_205219 [Capitella teleta]|uniref:Uncharacterized protein n=1 Tax=Capitella teleta TaxID=283909 RepID=R7VJ13_CAPTE|nr:hypothetical protein CAPTEDRAFT_205219 [Capitella teleta]|eukprot:ELU18552.1 hypothetical protein CAPTEDRAFT_205219 [Capitella teleta]